LDLVLPVDIRQTIIDTLLKPALAYLHVRAYQLCREDELAEGDQSYLADVMSGGVVFGIPITFLIQDSVGETLIPAGLAQDIQYCASDLTVQVYDGVDLLSDQTQELGGGDEAGAHATEGVIEVPVAEGVLSLEGIIRPLRCATPTTAAAYEASTLVITFNGVTVATLSHANGDFLPTNSVELNVSDMYTAAGLNPGSPGSYPLQVVRQGTGCNGVYGETSVPLFDLTITSAVPPPTLGVRLIERAHRATLTYNLYAADTSVLHDQTFQTQYTGALDSFQPYSDSTDPPAHSETIGSTTGTVDGEIQQSANLVSDGSGHVASIAQSGTFSAQATLTDGNSLCCVDSEGDFGNTENYVEFAVEGEPVAYTLSGTLSVTSDYYLGANGLITLSGVASGGTDVTPVSYAVCSGDTSMNPGVCDGETGGPMPPAANLNSNGVLQPGTYFLTLRLGGQAGVERTEVTGSHTTKQADGSYNVTLTFSPAP
jgi:hypothetical protein